MMLINLWLNINYQITTKCSRVPKLKFFRIAFEYYLFASWSQMRRSGLVVARKEGALVWRPVWQGKNDDFFFIFIFKKIKISKIYGGFEKFQNYTRACRPLAGRQDLNVKKNYI